jgi:hypothetical protein
LSVLCCPDIHTGCWSRDPWGYQGGKAWEGSELLLTAFLLLALQVWDSRVYIQVVCSQVQVSTRRRRGVSRKKTAPSASLAPPPPPKQKPPEAVGPGPWLFL